MTFKVTVRDLEGNLVNDLFVGGNNLMTGFLASRSTAAGYADVAMPEGSDPKHPSNSVGDHVTLWVQDPELRFKGVVMGDALLITEEDQELELVVTPF